MHKKKKIQAAIRGDYLEQIPYAFWTHLPGIDLDAEKLAEHTYEFYKKYNLDFIKTMNNGMYAIEDFGCEIDYTEIIKGGVAKIVKTPIEKNDDWLNIKKCSIEEGSLKRELHSLKLLQELVKDEAPIIFTVFSPITIAAKLSNNKIFEHIEDGGKEKVHKALREITDTVCDLVDELVKMDVDGIFFAVQTSSYNITDEKTYKEFGVPYDMEVLRRAERLWFNVLHAHGENIMMKILRDYPVQVFNWHAWETYPEIDQGIKETNKCIMSGISRKDITNSNLNAISNQIFKTIKLSKRRNLIVTPGCVIRYPLEEDTLFYVKDELEFWENILKMEEL